MLKGCDLHFRLMQRVAVQVCWPCLQQGHVIDGDCGNPSLPSDYESDTARDKSLRRASDPTRTADDSDRGSGVTSNSD